MTDFLFSFMAAVGVFFITNWIGKHSLSYGYFQIGRLSQSSEAPAFNFVYRIFAPTAILTIFAALLYLIRLDSLVAQLKVSIFLYFTIRLAFNAVTGRLLLMNFVEFFGIAIVSIGLYLIVHEYVIKTRELFFPTAQEVGAALWLGLAGFLYKTINSIEISESGSRRRRQAYVSKKKRIFERKFGHLIEAMAKNEDEKNLLLGVLIYEGLNRPPLFQKVERLVFRVKGKASLGPMQLQTDRLITDEESVRLGGEKLLGIYRRAMREESDLPPIAWRNTALTRYNGSNAYAFEIEEILERLNFSNGS